jgi:uncharacterized membrane protein
MIGFYVFMLICVLLLPGVMLFLGYRWQQKPTSSINAVFGYRTWRSMSSKQAWDYAHRHCGRIWVKCGWFSAVFAVLSMILLGTVTLDVAAVGIAGRIITCLELLPAAASLAATERALKRVFEFD